MVLHVCDGGGAGLSMVGFRHHSAGKIGVVSGWWRVVHGEWLKKTGKGQERLRSVVKPCPDFSVDPGHASGPHMQIDM